MAGLSLAAVCLPGRNVAALMRGSTAAAETGRGAPVERGSAAAAATDGGVAAESAAAAGRGGGGTESTTSSESPLTFVLLHPNTQQLRVWEGLVEMGRGNGWVAGRSCVIQVTNPVCVSQSSPVEE